MKSLSRGLSLLTELSKDGQARTLSELSASVGLHKSTVHRMLATLCDHGLVRQDEMKRYIIGLGALELAKAVQGQKATDTVVTEALTALGADVGEHAYYGKPAGRRMDVLAFIGRNTAGTVQDLHSGVRIPDQGSFHATAVGKAYLAFRPPAEISSYLADAPFPAETAHTITERDLLARVLKTVRRRGYAVENRESHLGLRRIGTPVLDQDGHAVAAVAVAVPRTVSKPDVERLSRAVVTCAGRIERGLYGTSHGRSAIPQAARIPVGTAV